VVHAGQRHGRRCEAIGRFDLQTGYTQYPFSKAKPGLGRITVGPDGALWFTERARYRIGRISTDGKVTEFPLKPGTVPADITAGKDGAIWFTTVDSIGRITTKGVVRMWPIPGAKNLFGIAPDRDGALWITDPEAGLLRRFEPPAR
jgi:virginiamycin B lyase